MRQMTGFKRKGILTRKVISQPISLVALFTVVLSLVLSCSLPFNRANSLSDKVYDPSLKYVSTNSLGLGTNLTSVVDWSTELPFLDGFKSAREWMPQCTSGDNCNGGWSTGETDKLDLDEHGWVKSLPKPGDGVQFTQVSTLLFREIQGKYPGGQYVVLYDGEGKIEYGFDARKDEAASRPGRDIINVEPAQQGIYLTLKEIDPNNTGNYIRNIRVVPIEYENTFEAEIFNPVFLERIKRFGVIRFMDWMDTNNSEQQEWANRPKVDDATYAIKGVPLEIMIELSNRLRAHPWFNMPHKATDEYMTNFAQMVKERLDPNLKAYVEFSNEVWNWMFSQAQYALKEGKARWGEDKGDAFVQWYGMRTAQMSDIWKQVFGDQRDRVISVMATQTAWQGLETSILDCPLWVAEGNQPCYQHGIDAYAITGYFSGDLGSEKYQGQVEGWLNDADGGVKRAMTQLAQGDQLGEEKSYDTVNGLVDTFKYHLQVAQEKELQMLVYEGGQSLANPNSEKLTDFFIKLNREPEMRRLYDQLLVNWEQSGGTMFMNFSDVGIPSKWGSWGVLEYIGQESSPKYDALIDFIQKHNLR
jgi:hypothetical protein